MCGGNGAVAIAPGAGAAVGTNGAEKIQLEWVSGMNCTGFDRVVVEMARGELMEAAAQREAAAHANTCARCARRLANEQRLSGAMATVAMEDSRRVAPAAVERMLLAELRKWHTG